MKDIQIILFLSFGVFALCNPKKYNPEHSGFKPSADPSPRRYSNDSPFDLFRNDSRASESHNRLQRFGVPPASYGPPDPSGLGGSGYPGGTGIGYYPAKFDVGGIALGALLGLGIIVIAPKIAQIFFGLHGGAYRNLDDDSSSISSILAKLDNTLEESNIDSSSCMQRALCTYVQEAQKNVKSGEAGPMDDIISILINNPVLNFMLDGSTVKQAIDMGKRVEGENCSAFNMKCPISKENITQIITKLLP